MNIKKTVPIFAADRLSVVGFMRPEAGQPASPRGITLGIEVVDVDAEHEILDPIGLALYIHPPITLAPAFAAYYK